MAKKPTAPTIAEMEPQEFLELMIYATNMSSKEEGKLLENITDANSDDSKRAAKRLAESFFRE
ncbi:MAG: hypothetical protein V3T10_02895 [Candidatus Bathyarchaeia archaeon]